MESDARRQELALLVLTLVLAFLASLGPTIEFDLWFRLRYGQEILDQHAVLRYADFLWPSPTIVPQHQPGIDWLFSVLMTLAYNAGGLAVFPFLKSALVSVFVALQWRALRLAGLAAAWRVPLLALVYKLYESRLMLRPQLCTDIFLTLLVVWSLERQGRVDRKLMLFVIPLFALWSNLHLGVSAGFVFLGVLFVQRSGRKAALLVLLAVAAACLRPDGPAFLLTTAEHMNDGADHAYNLEWQPMELSVQSGIYLAFTLVALAIGWRRRSERVATATVVAALAWGLALRQVRAVGELAAVTPAMLVLNLPPLPRPRWLAFAVGAALAVLLLREARRPDLLQAVPPHFYPEEAVRMIQQNGGGGVFCSYHLGGYLTFNHLQPYVHGMTTFFAPQRFNDYIARLHSSKAPQELLDDGVRWALLHYAPDGDVHAALARNLAAAPGWGLVYFDDAAMLFEAHPKESYHALMPAVPTLIVGPVDQAEAELKRLEATLGPDADWVLQGKARVAEIKGDDAAALAAWTRLIEHDPDRSAAWLARGVLLFRKGDLAGSRRDLETYVSQQNDSAVGHFNLALVLLKSGQLERARSEVKRAHRLDPSFEPAERLREQLSP